MGVAAWVCGCVDDPSTADPITLGASATSVPADGTSEVTLMVTAVSDMALTLTASEGTFVNSPAPAAGAPATTTVVTARGSAPVTYRAGLTPGPVVITATGGPYTTAITLTLEPSLPTQIALSQDRSSVPGDGVSFVQVQTTLLTAHAPALVSDGTVIEYAVCCAGMNGAPTDCAAGAAPLTIATLESTSSGEPPTVKALASHLTMGTSAFIFARLYPATATSTVCEQASMNAPGLSNAIAVEVTGS
jgi:hypothetical protein